MDLNPKLLKLCIEAKKNLVIPSYCSDIIKSFERSVVDSGIRVITELGVCPGLDHALTCSQIDKLKAEGYHINSYIEWVGGLPALEFANNPLKYKVSWSPEGVLSALIREPTFKRNGEVNNVISKVL